MRLLILNVLIFSIATSYAGSRSSADYSIPTDSIDAAGARTQSANYSFNGTAAGEGGNGAAAIATSTDYSSKPGYVGQLYDIVSLSISAPPSTSLNENASRQLGAAPQADDLTTLAALNPNTVSWSVVNGPITSITTGGLATAAAVYQDTAATVGGSANSLSGQLVLTILNDNIDNYQQYAADGIDDAWQVQYFGQPPNPLAGPNADADGTGQNNLFKYVAGLNPLDGSRFLLRIQAVAGQSGQKQLIFSPRFNDRTYTPRFRTSLTSLPDWANLGGTTQSDNGNERTVTDLSATGADKFYDVQITKP